MGRGEPILLGTSGDQVDFLQITRYHIDQEDLDPPNREWDGSSMTIPTTTQEVVRKTWLELPKLLLSDVEAHVNVSFDDIKRLNITASVQ